jgi:PAS domain S-box-containing protein
MPGSIRRRFAIRFVSLAVGPLLLVGAAVATLSIVAQVRDAILLQREVAHRVAVEVAGFVRESENEIHRLIRTFGLQPLDRDRQALFLSELIARNKSFEEIALLNSQGREEIRIHRLQLIAPGELMDRSKSDEFLRPASTHNVYHGPLTFDLDTHEPLMLIAVPQIDMRTDKVIAVIVARIRFKVVWDLLHNVPLDEQNDVYVIDSTGRLIAHRMPSMVLKGTHFELPANDGIHNGLNQTSVLLAASQIQFDDQTLHVVAERPTSDALTIAANTLLLTGGLIGLALLAAGVLLRLLVHQIVQPVEQLSAAAQAITRGDLSRRVSVVGSNEVSTLASAFNHMTEQLQQTLEAQARFVSILESTPDFALITDTKSHLIFLNQAARKALGFGASEDVSALTSFDLHPPHMVSYLRENASPVVVGRGVWTGETVFLSRSGQEIPTLQVILAHHGPDGNVAFYSSVARDITERKRVELALRNSEERFRQMAENIHEAFRLIDVRDHRILYVSPAYEAIWGRSVQYLYDANERAWLDTIHSEDRQRIANLFASSESIDAEYRIVRPDDSIRWVRDRGFPIRDEAGEIYRMVGIAEDITERKWREQQALELAVQKERVNVLTRFIRDASHDFKTPLSIINTALYVLERVADPEKQQDYLEKVKKQTLRLNKLVEDLLTIVRLESEADFSFDHVDVNTIVRDLEVHVAQLSEEKTLFIRLALCFPPPIVWADHKELMRALLELTKNAIFYTPDGGTVTIRTSISEAGVLIEFQDTGIGIHPTDLPHIFDHFYRVDQSRSTETGGIGLGLSIARYIINCHGGEITVESTIGKGSLFKVLLPLSDKLRLTANKQV